MPFTTMHTLASIVRGFRAMISYLQVFNLLNLWRKPSPYEPFEPNSAPTPSAQATSGKNLAGEVIGPYKLVCEIAKGTFGAVYYCVHQDTNEMFAAKFYSVDWIRAEDGMEIIEKELTVIKLLKHRNTVLFQDVVYTKFGILIVMELVRGRTLLDILPTGAGMVEPFARQIFVQFLDALEYLHMNRIIHRDIKLENVMIDFEGNVKIIDYGLSDYIPRSSSATDNMLVTNRCGSLNYFAPEVVDTSDGMFRGDLADIWASGVLLFTLVIGKFPFHQDDEDLMRVNILQCESWVKRWLKSDYSSVRVTPELKDLIREIFVKDPSRRLSIAQIKSHPWTMGLKLGRKRDESTKFSSSCGKVRVSFLDSAARRSLSCSGARGKSLNSHSGIQRCSSCPKLCFELTGKEQGNEDQIPVVPFEAMSLRETQSVESRKRMLRKALQKMWMTPKRMCSKVGLMKTERKASARETPNTHDRNDLYRKLDRKVRRTSLTIVERSSIPVIQTEEKRKVRKKIGRKRRMVVNRCGT